MATLQPEKKPSIDPLRRVFVPIEKRDVRGDWVFRTTDGRKYERSALTGVIRSLGGKANGKVARRARARARKSLRKAQS